MLNLKVLNFKNTELKPRASPLSEIGSGLLRKVKADLNDRYASLFGNRYSF